MLDIAGPNDTPSRNLVLSSAPFITDTTDPRPRAHPQHLTEIFALALSPHNLRRDGPDPDQEEESKFEAKTIFVSALEATNP